MHLRRSIVVLLAALACWCTPAEAFIVVSPDQICAPTADPCVLAVPVEVSDAVPLDFGRRVVRVEGEGRFTGSLDLQCGGFETEVDGPWIEVMPMPENRVTIAARRVCSNDQAHTCSADKDCPEGTCSIGDGGIRLRGRLHGIAPIVEFDATGDIVIEGKLLAAGDLTTPEGGWVAIGTSQGNILSKAAIDVRAGFDPEYDYPGYGGHVEIQAHGDIALLSPIRAIGAYRVELDAGRDIFVHAPITARGPRASDYSGGEIDIEAGRHLTIANDQIGRPVTLDSNGATTSSAHEALAGAGGDCALAVGGDLVVGEGVVVRVNSGRSRGYQDDRPYAGVVRMESAGNLVMNGRISAQGRGLSGLADEVTLESYGDLQIGSSASIVMLASYGARLGISGKDVRVDGQLDVHAIDEIFDGGHYGSGGGISVYADDFTVNGSILNGGGEYGGELFVSACAMHLGSTGRIDLSLGAQEEYPGEQEINLRHSMIAEEGSVILTNPESPMVIYHDENRPPVLLGSIAPPPALAASPHSFPCQLCGNSRTNLFESCDHGNTQSGDGCDGTCQLER